VCRQVIRTFCGASTKKQSKGQADCGEGAFHRGSLAQNVWVGYMEWGVWVEVWELSASVYRVYKGRKPSVDVERGRELKESGMGGSAIAKEMGIGRASVYRALG